MIALFITLGTYELNKKDKFAGMPWVASMSVNLFDSLWIHWTLYLIDKKSMNSFPLTIDLSNTYNNNFVTGSADIYGCTHSMESNWNWWCYVCQTKWYLKAAAEGGNVRVMNNITPYYLVGEGLPQNRKLARNRWNEQLFTARVKHSISIFLILPKLLFFHLCVLECNCWN